MSNKQIHRFKTITEFHRNLGLPEPEHPLFSVFNVLSEKPSSDAMLKNFVLNFYVIALVRDVKGKIKYGQQEYDLDAGSMFFMTPDQVWGCEFRMREMRTGWMILIHPDFLWNTPLAKTIKQYEYFGYSVNEALFLSEKEEAVINGIRRNIEQEYHSNIDEFSQDIIISQIDGLLNYAERFYRRQFITRKISNHEILGRMEKVLDEYFDEDIFGRGVPTVQYVADNLAVSPNYLGTLLKLMTGQNTQQHIHNKLVDKAKVELSTTDLSVSEIAYDLGFEHPQSFSRFFKKETQLSPSEFRHSFN